MNTFSHIMMGKLLYQYARDNRGINLDAERFILGNVLPDFCPSFLTRPHYLKNCGAYVNKEIQALLGKHQKSAYCGRSDSKKIGMICHYYADFFCHAHSEGFPDDMALHVRYESELHRYFQAHYRELRQMSLSAAPQGGPDAELLWGAFEQLHHAYLAQPPSFECDLTYTVIACLQLMTAVTAPATERVMVCTLEPNKL